MLKSELQVALTVVSRAANLAQSVFNKLVTAETVTKNDKSPVTVADYSCQALISLLLSKSFPNDPIVGEEDANDLKQPTESSIQLKNRVTQLVNAELSKPQSIDAIDRGTFQGGSSGRMWCLDPIDGTKGFLRGGQYAVCLALLVEGKVQLGVIACPNLPVNPSNPDSPKGVVLAAVKGQGAFQRPISETNGTLTPIRMNPITPESLSYASFCESVESGHSSQSDAANIANELGITNEPVRMDSQAKYCSISRGDGDIYLRLPVSADYEEKIWDHAPGRLIVAEAGGKVTDIHNNDLDFSLGRTLKNNKGVIAASADIHADVIKAVQKHPNQLLDQDQQTEIVTGIATNNAASNKIYRSFTLLFIATHFLSLLLRLDMRGNVLNLIALLFPLPSLLNTLTQRDLMLIAHPALRNIPEPRSHLLGLTLSLFCLLLYRNTASTRTVLALAFSTITETWMRTCEKEAQDLHKLKYAQKSA
ncbi:hypothetical protein E3P94_01199 [Wallemia ichthyophaga]|nr:hypothetical protein E3P95_01067 [Wallemia ichthyophaga]TIB02921.1 hypothetical protein E3P94_01199 [Wallemia ichthyophaga]